MTAKTPPPTDETAEYVARLVDQAPPLTEAQRARIGMILRAARKAP